MPSVRLRMLALDFFALDLIEQTIDNHEINEVLTRDPIVLRRDSIQLCQCNVVT